MNKIIFLCTFVLISTVLAKPAPQLEHLIIPYEDADNFNPSPEIDSNQPDVWTSYNVGVYTGGDYLAVPLAASYKVGLGSPDTKFKRGSQAFSLTQPAVQLKKGIVL